MIPTIALNIIYAFIAFLLNALPAAEAINPNIHSAFGSAASVLSLLDVIFPVNTLISVITLLVVVEGVILAYKALMWIKNLVW